MQKGKKVRVDSTSFVSLFVAYPIDAWDILQKECRCCKIRMYQSHGEPAIICNSGHARGQEVLASSSQAAAAALLERGSSKPVSHTGIQPLIHFSLASTFFFTQQNSIFCWLSKRRAPHPDGLVSTPERPTPEPNPILHTSNKQFSDA